MRNAYFSGNTVDDVFRDALQAIEEFGERVRASKGHTMEVRGIMIELCVPRARLSGVNSLEFVVAS